MNKYKIFLLLIATLYPANSQSFYPKTEDASTCNGYCYYEKGCMPGTACFALVLDGEWHTGNGQYTECQEWVASWSLDDMQWQTKFEKQKACQLKVAQEEPNEKMKLVQTCNAGCLDKVIEYNNAATCLADSSCTVNLNRCTSQCLETSSCSEYSCYGSKEYFEDTIQKANETCNALKEKNGGIFNLY